MACTPPQDDMQDRPAPGSTAEALQALGQTETPPTQQRVRGGTHGLQRRARVPRTGAREVKYAQLRGTGRPPSPPSRLITPPSSPPFRRAADVLSLSSPPSRRWGGWRRSSMAFRASGNGFAALATGPR
jgi:hypothetical protein